MNRWGRRAGVMAGMASLVACSALAQQRKQGSSLDERTGSTRVTWRTRTLVGNDRLLVWHTATSADAFRRLTFLEAVAETDKLGMGTIEGSSRQQVSPQIRKNLDHSLTGEEIAQVQAAL